MGSQLKLEYQMGTGELSLDETIMVRGIPERFVGTYETKGVWNLVDSHFKDNSDDTTTWNSYCGLKFSVSIKVMSWFMPKSMFFKDSMIISKI